MSDPTCECRYVNGPVSPDCRADHGGITAALRDMHRRERRVNDDLREEVRDLTATLEHLTAAAASRERRVNELADFIRQLRVRLQELAVQPGSATARHTAATLLAEMGEAPDWRPGDERGWVS